MLISSTFSDLEHYMNQKKQLIHDLKAQDSNIDGKHSQIDPILRCVTKVLMARTKLVSQATCYSI